MTRWTPNDAPYSLATAPPGKEFRVADVLFEHVRAHCRELGIVIDGQVRCTGQGDDGVRVHLRDGRDVLVPWDFAHFVRLSADERAPAAVDLYSGAEERKTRAVG